MSKHHCARIAAAATTGSLLLASGALAAPAAAATISAGKACYVNVNPATGAAMTITGSGFTPGDTVDLSGGTVSATTAANAAGDVVFTANAPALHTTGPGAERTTLTATDQGNGLSVTTVVRSANLSVATKPGSVKNVKKDRVTFSFSGFAPGKHIYGFYARKKIVAHTRFGKASGACGVLQQKALLYPGGRPPKNQYTVTFESTPKYSKRAFPRVTGKLSILPV